MLPWEALFELHAECATLDRNAQRPVRDAVFDRDWLRAQPDIVLAEFATVLAMARRFGSRDIAWDQSRPTERLPDVLGKLLQ